MQDSPAPAPLRGADHSSKKHPDRHHGWWIVRMFQVRSFSATARSQYLRSGSARRSHLMRAGSSRSQGFAPPGCGSCKRNPSGWRQRCLHGGCFRSVPNRRRPEPRRTALVVKPARNGARRADTGSGAICRPYRPMPPHNAQRSRDWAADARQVRRGRAAGFDRCQGRWVSGMFQVRPRCPDASSARAPCRKWGACGLRSTLSVPRAR